MKTLKPSEGTQSRFLSHWLDNKYSNILFTFILYRVYSHIEHYPGQLKITFCAILTSQYIFGLPSC